MKTIGLGSSPTSQPTMLCQDEMTYEKKYQFRGWTKRDYNSIRQALRRFWLCEVEEDIYHAN